MKNRRYVCFIRKGRLGHGLLSVFAKTRADARALGDAIAKPKRCRVDEVWSFRKFAAHVRWFAVNHWITAHTKI